MADTIEESSAEDDGYDLLEHNGEEQTAANAQGNVVKQKRDLEAVAECRSTFH